ncbi:hypothetical protein C0995_006092 [Termitomyces sp. Mi166|nr:hypothetical protein C0995_006092 [Termitomyces sp. Mi166\
MVGKPLGKVPFALKSNFGIRNWDFSADGGTRKYELYDDDLDEKERAQVLFELLLTSEAPLALKKTLGGKEKEKEKALAMADEEEEEVEEEKLAL